MPARAASPAVSENEVDIAGALAGDSDSDGGPRSSIRGTSGRQNESFPNLDGDSDGSDDDQFIALTQAASNRKAGNVKGRSVKKGGGFQAMGLSAHLLKAITRKGFSVPTPIQRRTIPLVLEGRDVVGMARTGSGKTAAFVVPMLEKLKAHRAQVGARGLILAPSRELALQTLKVIKELSRGTDLTAILLVGGDSLEEQFAAMASNPDIIVATPGRFLHLKVEMSLDLSSIQYIVFDEADRLFEMGFAVQLSEILAALPPNRQTLLFSATLPKSLVEFARAGLQEPSLVRLDAESKVSPDLQSAFFSVKSSEKEGALLHIIQDLIQMPTGSTEAAMSAQQEAATNSKKRKRQGPGHDVNAADSPTPFSTLVFAATKHHVDYLTGVLRHVGYAVSHVYGSLDQTARRMQVQDFRSGRTHIMIVTDVAARGIDIPILANVINYDFPAQAKVFVHRVGRTARAGKTGWSYSLVADGDVPYLLDLQLFLGRRLLIGRQDPADVSYASDVVAGGFVRDKLEPHCEEVVKLLDDDVDINALKLVAVKGEKLYRRTRPAASAQSAARAKEVVASPNWMEQHLLFGDSKETPAEATDMNLQRERMLARVSGFRPQETVFEIGRRGHLTEAGEIVRKRREGIVARKQKARESAHGSGKRPAANEAGRANAGNAVMDDDNDDAEVNYEPMVDVEEADHSDSTSEMSITVSQRPHRTSTAKDDSVFMSYAPTGTSLIEDKAYSIAQPSSFLSAARSVAVDLAPDEGGKGFAEPSRSNHQHKRWDRKGKKYVTENVDASGQRSKHGSEGATIRGEGGARLAASFRSGRFETWMKRNRLSGLPRVGETENPRLAAAGGNGAGRGIPGTAGRVGGRFQHTARKAPREADPKRDDFYKQRKKVARAREERVGRFGAGEGRSELKGLRDVQRERAAKAKRQQRNGPGKKGGRWKGKK